MGPGLFMKHSKFQNFDEYFTIGCFYTMSVQKNYFNKQKYGTVYLRNIQNSNKIDKILYCVMTRFRNVKLGDFTQYQNTKAILKKKNTGQNCFKKLSKFQRF